MSVRISRTRFPLFVACIFLALILLLQPLQYAHADSIAIDSECTLFYAIAAANTDGEYGGCPAGAGEDTFVLTEDITLSAHMPKITSKISVDGAGFTISGGGEYQIFRVGEEGSLEIFDVTLTNGLADQGGAIFVDGGDLTVNSSTFSDNSAGIGPGRHGGAIYIDSGTATITASTFSNNSASWGGALYNRTGTLSVQNSTLHNNSAHDVGGAIAIVGGEATFTHVTMANNVGVDGSSVFSDGENGSLNLYNSIITDSTRTGSCWGELDGYSGNLIKDGSCDPAKGGDPKLGDPTGSPVYYPLQDDSPAINAADPEYCLEFDQTNTVRASQPGGNCDVGSHENLLGISPEPTPMPVVCSLGDHIQSANKDTSVGACPAGRGADVIDLDSDVSLNAKLPIITSAITINGDGHVISGERQFLIFEVGAGGNLTINNLTLTDGDNTDKGNGGAIRVWRGGVLTVNDSTFTNNAATWGGAIQSYGTVTVRKSTFRQNNSDWGGAINSFGNLTVEDSSFIMNLSVFQGGAIESHAPRLEIWDSTFSDNESLDSGGAIWIDSRVATITHVTMYNDKARRGDGIFQAGWQPQRDKYDNCRRKRCRRLRRTAQPELRQFCR